MGISTIAICYAETFLTNKFSMTVNIDIVAVFYTVAFAGSGDGVDTVPDTVDDLIPSNVVNVGIDAKAVDIVEVMNTVCRVCLLYTSPSPRD